MLHLRKDGFGYEHSSTHFAVAKGFGDYVRWHVRSAGGMP
jgi:hypothetical protein